MSWKLETVSQLRPCYVDGVKALFHNWGRHSRVVEPSPMVGGAPGGTVSYILGIVEFEDGQIKQVFPEKIKFVDKMFDEYYWKGKSKKLLIRTFYNSFNDRKNSYLKEEELCINMMKK